MSRLVAGSPLAQAVWQVMSGRRVVVLPVTTAEDAILAGCQVIEYLVKHGSMPRKIVWAVDGVGAELRMADSIAGGLVEADIEADLYVDWQVYSTKMRISELFSDDPGFVLECRSLGPRYRRSIGSDLLVLEERLVATMEAPGVEVTAGQVLLLGSGHPPRPRVEQIASGNLPDFWGVIPFELTLAGAPC